MFKPVTRGVLAVITSVTFMVGESQACCFLHCFDCCKPAPAPVTTYAPACPAPVPVCPAPAPACNVCPQQVNYVPQTCYRTSYQCVPVTTCKPVTTCDPCGGAQTVMQPVTTYVRRPVMVPYTTYRPVVAAVNYAPACSTCSGAAYSSPYYGGAAAAAYAAPMAAPAAGCATCGGGAAATYAAPAATYGAPAMTTSPPMYTNPVPATVPSTMSPSMSMPSLNSAPSGNPTPATSAPPSTFQQNYTPQGATSQYPAPPIQDSDPKMNSSTSAPRLFDPQNRTTSTGPMIGPATVTKQFSAPPTAAEYSIRQPRLGLQAMAGAKARPSVMAGNRQMANRQSTQSNRPIALKPRGCNPSACSFSRSISQLPAVRCF